MICLFTSCFIKKCNTAFYGECSISDMHANTLENKFTVLMDRFHITYVLVVVQLSD